MKLKDMGIGLQLRIGLGAILGFVVLIGALAWFQADRLWQDSLGLYEHPLQIRRALGELQTDILLISGGMKDLALTSDKGERERIIQRIDTSEADAYRQFDLLRRQYLGPQSDIDEAYNFFVPWRAMRAETIRMLREGRAAAAASRIKAAGISGPREEAILKEISHISAFATQKGEQYYRDSRQHKDDLNVQLALVVFFILLVTASFGYLLLRGVRRPLQELTALADEYGRGNLEARSDYASGNEFGALAVAFNTLAEAVQVELKSKGSAGRIAEVMLNESKLRPFCRQLLHALTEHTGSQVGAVYLLNEAQQSFEHFESLGLSAKGRASFSAAKREGEFGAAVATQKIQHLSDIPAETCLTFSTVSGDFQPRSILTIPILSGPDVIAVISLASIHAYDAPAIRLVHDVWRVLTARLNGVLMFKKNMMFSEQLEHQNRELEAQKQELAMQKDELIEQNIELEMQKKQLDAASRLKSNFLSNMSHELRTPLNSVIALSGVLNRRLANLIPQEEYSYLDVIERNGKQLLLLINDILDLSRIEAGKEEINLSRFAVTDLVEEVVAMVEPQAREKQITLLNNLNGNLPFLTSDYQKCLHILQNIIGNAVKFTEQGGVTIAAAVIDDAVRITVTDTGIGIAPDRLPVIFDEFRQADEGTARKFGGSGLGLAIAKKYSTMLRGSILVKSAAGQGSTFTVQLPIMTYAAPIDGRPAAASYQNSRSIDPSLPPRPGNKTILLVEDSDPAVIQLKDILQEEGYRVSVAKNGKEALSSIAETLPDAMILDLMMPEVDGFQVLRTIRSAARTQELPVLILTAKLVTPEELSFLKGNHVSQLIQKGDINRNELLAAVGRMVAPPLDAVAPAASRPARRPCAEKPVILVVEDNPDNMKTVRALLQDSVVLVEALDGRAGVEQARQQKPDLILLDISLPLMDGFQVLAELRKEEPLMHIPVIALTARAMKGDREQILAHGFDGYISKPLDGKLLEREIRGQLYGQ